MRGAGSSSQACVGLAAAARHAWGWQQQLVSDPVEGCAPCALTCGSQSKPDQAPWRFGQTYLADSVATRL
jgi:hypothetical protein